MPKEHYEPSEEEMAKAEQTMSGGQKNISLDREKEVKGLEALGVHGHLDRTSKSNPDHLLIVITGELNGHTIELSYDLPNWADEQFKKRVHPRADFKGRVDDLELSEDDAEQLINI